VPKQKACFCAQAMPSRLLSYEKDSERRVQTQTANEVWMKPHKTHQEGILYGKEIFESLISKTDEPTLKASRYKAETGKNRSGI